MVSNYPIIGIDVAKHFCFYAAVSPLGKPFLKPFKAFNTKQGLLFALDQIKKVENAFGIKPLISLESTGHYSARIVHFFLKQGFEVFLINPLVSHSIKNSAVRKVKTDPVDALELAKLLLLHDFHPTHLNSDALTNLKLLGRTRFQLASQRITLLNQLVAAVEQLAPLFTTVFNPGSLTALSLLTQFPFPSQWLDQNNHTVILSLLESLPRRGKAYSKNKFTALLACAEDALVSGMNYSAHGTVVQVYAKTLCVLDKQIATLDDEIKSVAAQLPELSLLKTIPGIGDTLASIILGEIGDITRFNNSKQLVAFCGVDPSVKQSGNFIGSKNKISKRGSPFLRRALYLAATTAIRKDTKGRLVNPVIYEYYHEKVLYKPKKLALGAVMNKLVRIIYSVLKNMQSFHLISSAEQVELHLNTRKKAA